MKFTLSSILALISGLAVGALNPDHFRFERALTGITPDRTAAAAAALDAALHQSAADGYTDIRVLDDRAVEIPCAIEKAVSSLTRMERRPVESRAIALKELPGNRIEAEFLLGREDFRADGLEVLTPLRDFVRTLSVQGSADGKAWIPLARNAEICDYSRYLDVRRTAVILPPGSGPWFRVEIGNASEDRLQPLVKLVSQKGGRDTGAEIMTEELLRTPFRMEGIRFWRNEAVVETRCEIRREWELPAPAVVENGREKTTEMTLECGRLPLNRLVLASTSRNFSRRAEVQVRVTENGVSRWRDIAGAYIREVDLPGYAQSDMEINFPERRAGQMRVIIRNGDNPPLSDLKARAFGPVYRVLLLAEPGRSYRLLYGNDRAKAPAYDLESVLAPLRQGLQPGMLTLGPIRENPACHPPGRGVWEWLNHPALMIGVMVLAALVLLVVLAKSLRKVDSAGM